MSEPTYRVELYHSPEKDTCVQWRAAVRSIANDWTLDSFYGGSREEAFDKARAYIVRRQLPAEQSSTVFLSEDGDIIDRHEAGVLRDANA